MQPVVIVELEEIDAFEDTARQFFSRVFDMDLSEMLITDLSQLSDFASCGLPQEQADSASSLEELYDRWDAWIVPHIESLYQLTVPPTIRLVTLFRLIEAEQTRQVH